MGLGFGLVGATQERSATVQQIAVTAADLARVAETMARSVAAFRIS
jgi:methyl-accepting chemotaxis protein